MAMKLPELTPMEFYPPATNEAAEIGLLNLLVAESLYANDAWAISMEEGVSEKLFFLEHHKRIWRAIKELHEAKVPVDVVSVGTKVSNADIVKFLEHYLVHGPASTNAKYFIDYLKKFAVLRDFQQKHGDNVRMMADVEDPNKTLDEIVAIAQSVMEEATEAKGTKRSSKAADRLPGIIGGIEDLITGREKYRCVSTGFSKLDWNMGGGLMPGQVAVLAARPAVGKTTLAINFAINLARQGVKVAYFTVEMPADELTLKMISTIAKIPYGKIKRGDMNEAEQDRFVNASREVNGFNLYFNDVVNGNYPAMREEIKRLAQSEGVQVVIIDYIQQFFIPGVKQTHREQLVQITSELKTIANEHKISIIELAQVNRQGDKVPKCSDLKDSGSIEQDADVVILLYRNHPEDENRDDTTMYIGKSRFGRQGHIPIPHVRLDLGYFGEKLP